jgi:hypothetical protein
VAFIVSVLYSFFTGIFHPSSLLTLVHSLPFSLETLPLDNPSLSALLARLSNWLGAAGFPESPSRDDWRVVCVLVLLAGYLGRPRRLRGSVLRAREVSGSYMRLGKEVAEAAAFGGEVKKEKEGGKKEKVKKEK